MTVLLFEMLAILLCLLTLLTSYANILSSQLHAVSRTQQSRQREPNVKTLRFPLSVEFWRHCVLSGRTQSRAFASTPERRNGNINLNNISSPRVGIEPTTSRFYSHTLCHCATIGLNFWPLFYLVYNIVICYQCVKVRIFKQSQD